ncbi:MAG: pyridoxal-phosphate dependent enzyme [Nitrospirae bacterium]|nr:pyridoxal-phosphate dependent enzyme [Nitrospirota bacterium]
MTLSEIALRVGNTPLIDLTPPGSRAEIWAKVESHNLSGSVKDRAALGMIQKGLADGSLAPGRRIIEATSGNTGIGLAVIGRLAGYPVTIVAPPQASVERLDILRSAGAEVIFSDQLAGSNGALEKALSIYKADPEAWFWPNQYYNQANCDAHSKTADEIFAQTGGRVTHFVAATGTGGTAIGATRGLKRLKPSVAAYSVEPAEDFHGIEGTKHMATEAVPEIKLDGRKMKGIFETGKAALDGTLFISTDDAYKGVDLLAERGVFAGISSGANYIAALRMVDRSPGGVIVTVLPDGADRYLYEKIWSRRFYGPALTRALFREMGAYFEKCYPEEGCGLLLGVQTGRPDKPVIKKFAQVTNRNADSRNDRYDIDPNDYRRVEAEARNAGLKILGIAHSHPDHPPRPSQTDLDAAWEDFSYFIFSISGGGMVSGYSWRLENGAFREELIDIVGEHG